MAVNIHYVEFDLFCGDELIYTNSKYKNKYIKSIREAFNLIPISKKYTDKNLRIKFKSTLNGMRKLSVPSIYYGSKYALYSFYFDEGKRSLIWGMFFIISSIFILLSSIFFIKTKRYMGNIHVMGTFTFIIGLYICLRSWIPYYYIPNNSLIHFVDYTLILTMPIPLYLLFINHFNQNEYYTFRTKLLEGGAIITVCSLGFQYMMTFTRISEFVYFQKFTFFWVSFSLILISIILFSSDKKSVKNKRILIISIIPMLFISLIIVILYFISYNIISSTLIIFSIIFFILTNFILFIRNDIETYNSILENEFYEHLAYTDSLTHINNRNSFEEELEKINNKERKFKHISLFMIDMNFLKEINDNFGHSVGDLYLKEIGNILILIEQTFKNTYVYRYGGDEFIIISYDIPIKRARAIKKTISELSERFNLKNGYPLSLAIGHIFSENSLDFNFNDLFREVDVKMYEDKDIKKSIIMEGKNNER